MRRHALWCLPPARRSPPCAPPRAQAQLETTERAYLEAATNTAGPAQQAVLSQRVAALEAEREALAVQLSSASQVGEPSASPVCLSHEALWYEWQAPLQWL